MDTPDLVPVPSFPSSYKKGEGWLGQVDALAVSQGLQRYLQILVRTITATRKWVNTRSLGERKESRQAKRQEWKGVLNSHVTEQQAYMAVCLFSSKVRVLVLSRCGSRVTVLQHPRFSILPAAFLVIDFCYI